VIGIFRIYFTNEKKNFTEKSNASIYLPYLSQLDLRDCKLKTIWKDFLVLLPNLEYLFLSNNNIASLDDTSFILPSLIYLDLSFNEERVQNGDLPSPMKMSQNVFDNLRHLEFLDLSHTKIDSKAISSLYRLPQTIIGISLCYAELSISGDNFLSNLKRIKYLDVSGNTQLNFTKSMFNEISNTLERLDARDANVRNLEWTKPLTNLRVLNLKDNKIRVLDNNSFSHMLSLEDLNLERNSIGNWYTRLFTQNQELMTLNLRENTLTLLTEDMIEDLLSVRHLAIGKNEFECSCELHAFMHLLFDATKFANPQKLWENFDGTTTTTQHPIFLGARNNLRPEYDIMRRTYEKYYDQILKSIEALEKNNYGRKSKSLLSLSDVTSLTLSHEFKTVLLDYDVNNADYRCMNVTEKQRQSMLDLIEVCDNVKSHKYSDKGNVLIVTLATSIPTMLCISVLLFVIYWKWFHIRYFFVLCKNSAILTFMDDGDEGSKETIVRRKSNSSMEIVLYDVFVSYSDSNRDWVLNEFIPNIEKRESIIVCLHERDFTVGYGILENIISCMDRSRCLLLLVSENFLQSQWCQFEMNLAQHRLLETRREKLILVLLEDIPVKMQPKTLKYLMRTKTYIKWPANGTNDDKQLFWKRLKKSIISSKWENENYGSIA
jgi:Leucine-rich repeat (LRR) protein